MPEANTGELNTEEPNSGSDAPEPADPGGAMFNALEFNGPGAAGTAGGPLFVAASFVGIWTGGLGGGTL